MAVFLYINYNVDYTIAIGWKRGGRLVAAVVTAAATGAGAEAAIMATAAPGTRAALAATASVAVVRLVVAYLHI
jgi:hypothetical protein